MKTNNKNKMNKNKKEKNWKRRFEEEAENRKAKKDKIFKTENTFYRNIVCRVY